MGAVVLAGLRVAVDRFGIAMVLTGRGRGMGGEGARRSIGRCRRGRRSCELAVKSKSHNRFVHSMASLQHLSFRSRGQARVNSAGRGGWLWT